MAAFEKYEWIYICCIHLYTNQTKLNRIAIKWMTYQINDVCMSVYRKCLQISKSNELLHLSNTQQNIHIAT